MVVPLTKPRNAAATRELILAAARDRFSRHSYDDVRVRDLARDARVDAALISRYFGSKEDLFAAALDSCSAGADLFEGPRDTFARRIANQVVFEPKQGDDLLGMRIMLLSMGSTKASEIVQSAANSGFFGPFAAWLGGDDAAVRVRLIASLVMGLSISRELSGGSGLDDDARVQLRDRLATLIQTIIDDTPFANIARDATTPHLAAHVS